MMIRLKSDQLKHTHVSQNKQTSLSQVTKEKTNLWKKWWWKIRHTRQVWKGPGVCVCMIKRRQMIPRMILLVVMMMMIVLGVMLNKQPIAVARNDQITPQGTQHRKNEEEEEEEIEMQVISHSVRFEWMSWNVRKKTKNKQKKKRNGDGVWSLSQVSRMMAGAVLTFCKHTLEWISRSVADCDDKTKVKVNTHTETTCVHTHTHRCTRQWH